MSKSLTAVSAFAVVLLTFAPLSNAQSTGSGTVRGSVLDPSGAVIKGATVEIQNPVSQLDRTALTDGQGNFEFSNLPYNNYQRAYRQPRFKARSRI